LAFLECELQSIPNITYPQYNILPITTYGKSCPNYKKVPEIYPQYNILPIITYGLAGPLEVCYIGS
jgi:hypothetical protein